jgi:hypothetical protein
MLIWLAYPPRQGAMQVAQNLCTQDLLHKKAAIAITKTALIKKKHNLNQWLSILSQRGTVLDECSHTAGRSRHGTFKGTMG